ncbi:hypothetical protein PPTG_22962 [Phytophthora nicotianae INRA-310]|uniref:Uncharacterized protein n=1 Tax=Phytophthora nicotianae (strain INRA-310) TaxID=761204 RepID=W2Q901_PHYN3|nr:hypothetical protein PPTG_22962 [Phytophthora nicotianae INRA-310]ETN08745.1 hypothetical protein PPTG_22962 [Phytophthora nicotianae INRA-310]
MGAAPGPHKLLGTLQVTMAKKTVDSGGQVFHTPPVFAVTNSPVETFNASLKREYTLRTRWGHPASAHTTGESSTISIDDGGKAASTTHDGGCSAQQ